MSGYKASPNESSIRPRGCSCPVGVYCSARSDDEARVEAAIELLQPRHAAAVGVRLRRELRDFVLARRGMRTRAPGASVLSNGTWVGDNGQREIDLRVAPTPRCGGAL